MSGEVLLAREGEIATLTLSSPERLNALSLAMWEQLGSHAKKLGKDASLRCVVIRGAGSLRVARARFRCRRLWPLTAGRYAQDKGRRESDPTKSRNVHATDLRFDLERSA